MAKSSARKVEVTPAARTSPKAGNPVDKHVGSRLRMRRMLVGMSQSELGRQLGITFQQIQKYEKGTNRIGASRMHKIAEVLGVPVGFFYEGAPSSDGEGGYAVSEVSGFADFLATSVNLEMMKAFGAITDDDVKRRIVQLTRSIADARAVEPRARPKLVAGGDSVVRSRMTAEDWAL